MLLLPTTWRRRVSAAVAALCLGACSPSREAPATPGHGLLRGADGTRPNVLLLTVDTLRADHVEANGSPFRGLTPTLDQLASEGTLFVHTTSPAPATRPALAALITGSYSGRHAVLTNRRRLPLGIRTMAAVLKRAGYQTAALFGNQLLESSGFRRGFDRYETFVPQQGLSSDAEGVDRAIAWLGDSPKEPWFLWLHLMSPHGPYNSAPRRSVVGGTGEDPLPDRRLEPSSSNYGLGVLPRYQFLLAPPQAAEYRRRYRGEVFYADAQIGRLVRALDDHGLASSTLLIVTADHGESLGEQDLFFQHGWLPNEASVRVPLLWRLPGRVAKGHRVMAGVSLVDVMPTLLSGLGIAIPYGLAGRDLTSALGGGEPPEAAAFTMTAYANRMTAVRRGDWKLVHTPPPPNPLPNDYWRSFYAEAESYALYDLARDPGEERDQSAAEPERVAALRAELTKWEKENRNPPASRTPPPADAATQERLRALGYAD